MFTNLLDEDILFFIPGPSITTTKTATKYIFISFKPINNSSSRELGIEYI